MPELHVKPTTTKSVQDRRWLVFLGDDPTPVASAATRAEAETAARVHARNFGVARIFVHGVDGEIEPMFVTPDRPAPTPRDVKGPAAF